MYNSCFLYICDSAPGLGTERTYSVVGAFSKVDCEYDTALKQQLVNQQLLAVVFK